MEYNEKQLQILQVAERLFATHGFDGTSVRDIAKEADVNVAMISYYFGSKEKLLQKLFEQKSEFIKLQIESLLENKTLTPLGKIYQLIETFVDKILKQQNFHRLMVCVQATGQDIVISEAMHNAKKRNHELIRKVLQEGQKAGVFKKNIDVPLLMATLIGTGNQLVTTQRFYRELNNMENATDEEFQKFLRKKLVHHLKTLFKATLTYEE